MAHFYGTLRGSRTSEATKSGGKDSGLQATAAGWGGAIRTELFVVDGRDYYRVMLTPWASSGGTSRVVAEGFLDATLPVPT